MNYGGEAADQIVRMSLNGVEIAAKISGKAAERLAVLLYSVLKDQKKTKGKTRLTSMIKSGKELRVFAVKDQDLERFCQEAKRYGVLYCVLKDNKADDGLTDIMVRADDASKINRIFERFKFYSEDMGKIQSEIENERKGKDDDPEGSKEDQPEETRSSAEETKGEDPKLSKADGTEDIGLSEEGIEQVEGKPPVNPDPETPASSIPGEEWTGVPEQTVSQKDRVDAYISRVVTGGAPEKEEAGTENPTMARTARSLPSGHSSEPRKERSDTRGNEKAARSDERDRGYRPSVKKELEEIKRIEIEKKAVVPVPEKSPEHIAPPVKKPQVKERG